MLFVVSPVVLMVLQDVDSLGKNWILRYEVVFRIACPSHTSFFYFF